MSRPLVLTLALGQISLGLDSGSVYAPVVVNGVTVPQYGVEGKHAVLYCSYRSVQPVYSVRWYKNGKEFYSYRPGKLSPITVHSLPGINVDVTQSNIRQVTLSPLMLATTGRYRCEVSEEAPAFATDSKFGDLLVVVVPKHGPRIVGAHERYSVGEEMRINCTSEKTLPPANLTWYINQQPVSEEQVLLFPVQNTTVGGGEMLHTATLGLHHKLIPSDYRGGEVKIRCVASIYSAYYQGTEVSLGRRRRRGRKSREKEGRKGEGRVHTKQEKPGSKEQLKASPTPSSSSGSPLPTMQTALTFLTFLLTLIWPRITRSPISLLLFTVLHLSSS